MQEVRAGCPKVALKLPRDINTEMFTKVVPRRAVNFSIGAFCTEFRCEQLCDDDTFFWIGVNFWPSFGHLLQFEEVQRTANRLPSNSGSVNREPEAEPVQRFDFEPPNPPSAIIILSRKEALSASLKSDHKSYVTCAI